MIDFEPTDEQQLIVDTVRQFAASLVRPRARECAESRKLPEDVLARGHELGLVANALPEAFGGGGERSALTGALIAEELAYGDLAIALAILSPSLLALPVADFGTEEQRHEILPLFTGERFAAGSLAIVEPHLRSDALRPRTRATRDGDEWRLTGEKCFVPWLDDTSYVLVSAATEATEVGQGFLVPRGAAGVRATPERNMGLDALPTVELALEDVRLPLGAQLGGPSGADLGQIVDRGRVGLAAAAVGVARAAYDVAREYAKQREAFGAPIATKQAIAFCLANMAIEIDGLRLLTWEAAWTLDQGRDATRPAALAQRQAARVALDVCDGAVQVLGGHGYTREYLPEMHLRNARGFALLEAPTLV